MVSGAVALPTASSPAGSARRTTGSDSAAASPPIAKAAKARAAASNPNPAALARPLIPPLLIALHGTLLRVIDLAHRLRGRHLRRAEGAWTRSGGDLRAAEVAPRIERRLRLGVRMVLLLDRHRPEARVIHMARFDRCRLGAGTGASHPARARGVHVGDGGVGDHPLVVDVVNGRHVHVGD